MDLALYKINIIIIIIIDGNTKHEIYYIIKQGEDGHEEALMETLNMK